LTGPKKTAPAYGLIFENKKDTHYTMSGNKLIKTIMNAAVLTGLAAGIG